MKNEVNVENVVFKGEDLEKLVKFFDILIEIDKSQDS